MMRAPFPYFGGKSGGARLIWSRLGDTPGYIEPFAGSLAVLLARPFAPPPSFEIVNDLDGSIVNFWRSVKWSPDQVAKHADWPRCELDLHARQDWIHERLQTGREMLRADMRWHDPEWAGVWCWAMSLAYSPNCVADRLQSIPAGHPQGIQTLSRRDHIPEIMSALGRRMKHTAVLCGDWSRSVALSRWPGGWRRASILLDPPYLATARESGVGLYAEDSGTIAHEVRTWAIENGDNPRLRIALCCFRGEHDDHMPETWECCDSTSGSSGAGFANVRADSKALAKREVVWFSPHCLRVHQPGLFDQVSQ